GDRSRRIGRDDHGSAPNERKRKQPAARQNIRVKSVPMNKMNQLERAQQSTTPADNTVVLRSGTNEAPQARRSPAPEQTQSRNETAPATKETPRSRDRRSVRWALFALLPLALIAGGYWYVTGGQVMSTDDAYVEADKVGISTDISGIVQDVDVSENQHVAAGQILYRLDPRQFEIALENANANLAQIELTIESMKQDYQR